jgi:hypothetical protein
MPGAAKLHGSVRWSDFLGIEPLRAVHVEAIRGVARALGSPAVAVCSDANDEVCDVFCDGGMFEDFVGVLRAKLGTPIEGMDAVPVDVAEGRRAHDVWFYERV